MYLVNRDQVIVGKTTVAVSRWARLRGLLGQRALQPGEGLLLISTKAIHTIGMRYAIDVAFLDRNGRILHLIHNMQPFQCSPLVRNSVMVLELPAGILQQSGTKRGDCIKFG